MSAIKLDLTADTLGAAYARPGGGPVSIAVTVTGTAKLKVVNPQYRIRSVDLITIDVRMDGGSTETVVDGSSWSANVSGTVNADLKATINAMGLASGTAEFYEPEIRKWLEEPFTAEGEVSKEFQATLDDQAPSVAPVPLPREERERECPAPGSLVEVKLSGTANDWQSGVAGVFVGLDKDNPPAASPDPGTGWANWKAIVNIPARLGEHTIYCKAADKAGNVSAPVEVKVRLNDTTPPELGQVSVSPSTILIDDRPVSVTVSGTVSDVASGVDAVLVSLWEDRAGELVEVIPEQTWGVTTQEPNQTASWSGTLLVQAEGNYEVKVRARDRNNPNNPSPFKEPYPDVTVAPIPKPVPTITFPPDGYEIPGTSQGADGIVTGTATAEESQITAVYVVLDNAPFDESSKADPGTQGWSTWSKTLHIPAQGSHTITVKAVNAARNPDRNHGEASVTVTVGVSYKPADDQDNISLLAYFNDLLVFARKRIEITDASGSKSLVTNALLKAQFHQPFDVLKADEHVQQIRICVEVLRGYLKGRTPDVAAEARYRRAAYQALLTQFGTSYDELRRLSRAPANDEQAQSERKSLGGRIGIALDSDKLNRLFVTPDRLTEAELEVVFGLVDTMRDPLQSGQPPLLFEWQMDYLHRQWASQDSPVQTSVPLIDPDLLTASDFKSTSGDAYRLWESRAASIAGEIEKLVTDRQPGESDHDRLVRLVGQAMTPVMMTDLVRLDSELRDGRDIAGKLALYQLAMSEFKLLIRIHNVPVDQAFLEEEWDDLYSILVQVMKRKRFAEWRQQEAGLALVLGPIHFAIAPEDPLLPAWRATAEARRLWQDKLQARIDQQETTRQAYLSAVAAAESVALPVLREALVAAVSTRKDIDVANWLTQRLMIDVKAAGGIRTTRITQAIETIQAILAALRAERFMEIDDSIAPRPPGDWNLTEPNVQESEIGEIFDQEWTWMGDYASWRAAMRVFLYPENLLLPSLRRGEDTTPEFDEMMKCLRNQQRISPKAAREVAKGSEVTNGYKGYLGSLKPEVTNGLNAWDSRWAEATFVLDDSMAEVDLEKRAEAIQKLVEWNAGKQPLQQYVEELFFFVPMQLGLQLHQAGHYAAAFDWFRTVYAYNLPVGRRKVYYGLTQEEANPSVYQTADQWLRTKLNPHDIAPVRAGAFTRFTVLSIVRCFLDFADAEFASDTGEAVARARTLYLGAFDLLGSADMLLPDGREPAEAFGFNANPEPKALRLHAELSLAKIRSGRNIAGMQRQAGEAASGGAEAPITASLRPTPYRYTTLIERAKQLVTLAQQIEERYLSALEKQDAETYSLMKARHDLHLTQATIQLQDLRVVEASDGVSLARLQKSRSQTQASHYEQLLLAGLSEAERENFRQLQVASGLQLSAAATSMFAASLPASLSAGVSVGFPSGGSASFSVSTSPSGEASAIASSMSSAAGAASTIAGISSARASYERREQEWKLQKSVAQKDVEIGDLQYQQAQHHQRIATQERLIAQMQSDHAQATVDFLANKFTNAELYQWMSGILGRVYAYFLQQATAIARLAENQLAFERQERPLAVIRPDYWQAAEEDSGGSGGRRDRKGLTGSARLLQDIYQLDQYAFETNKRKLQLSKTLSLASLAPLEFERFRDSGVLVFATPMTLFDQDFPGHYLRLIRRVNTSVVALIPPNQGIRATLGTAGLSRVVIPDGGFRMVTVRRDPELVALTSPLNASGLFELDTQPELLLPFEGMGVDGSWILEMPRAANPFDFRTIADVLITVEYTALHSYDYRQQVVQQLNREVNADRPFSLRDQFPDQWYELNNREQGTSPPTMRFTTSPEFFPPNVENLKIAQVLLYFVGKLGKSIAVPKANLQLSYLDEHGKSQTAGGDAQPIDSVISTRRSNGSTWRSLIGKPPIADWTLQLIAGEELNTQLRNGELEDILLVISYAGETPPWPQ